MAKGDENASQIVLQSLDRLLKIKILTTGASLFNLAPVFIILTSVDDQSQKRRKLPQ